MKVVNNKAQKERKKKKTKKTKKKNSNFVSFAFVDRFPNFVAHLLLQHCMHNKTATIIILANGSSMIFIDKMCKYKSVVTQ